MTDIRDKVLRPEGKLKQLAATLPGYGGYLQKEMRRDADKILRNELVRRLSQEKARLNQLSAQAARRDPPDMDVAVSIETITTRLQTITDKIRHGTYGYAGFFDALTVREDQIDALYDFDAGLLDKVSLLSTAIDTLMTAIAGGQRTAEAFNAVSTAVADLATTWEQRTTVILGQG